MIYASAIVKRLVTANFICKKMEQLKTLGSFFYIVNPYESLHEKLSDIPNPDYLGKAGPFFFALIILEQIILKLKGKDGIRINDGFSSVSGGIIMSLRELLMKGTMISSYIYIYENWKIYDLPWDSVYTWIIAAILVDFAYYWVHRAAHELNILWAAHQVGYVFCIINTEIGIFRDFCQSVCNT